MNIEPNPYAIAFLHETTRLFKDMTATEAEAKELASELTTHFNDIFPYSNFYRRVKNDRT